MRPRTTPDRAASSLLVMAALLAAGGGEARAQVRDVDAQWSATDRRHAYTRDLVGPGALFATAAATTVGQIRNDPEEWGDDAPGLGRRAASNVGGLLVEQSVRHGLAVALGRSTRYEFCECQGFGPRFGHALRESFTDRDRARRRMVSVPRVTASFAGAFAQRLWQPGMTAGEAALAGGSRLLLGAAGNAVREFVRWPR